MQFIKHDFWVNFNNAVKYEDSDLLNELIIDEIAKILVFNRDAVIISIINSGINLQKLPNDQKLVEIIISNIAKNEKLRNHIIALIFKNNTISNQNYDLKKLDKNINNSKLKNLKQNIKRASNMLNFTINSNFSNASGNELFEKVNKHKFNKKILATNNSINYKKLYFIYSCMGIFAGLVAFLSAKYFIKKNNFNNSFDNFSNNNFSKKIEPKEDNINFNNQDNFKSFENSNQINQQTNFPEPDLKIIDPINE